MLWPTDGARQDFTGCTEKEDHFPEDFAFGVATASYQIEGAYNIDGKGSNIWDEFTRFKDPCPTANCMNGDVADDFYHKYPEDVEMMKGLNIKHFRMSLSWARLLPDGIVSNPNPQGIAFYRDVFTKLNNAGIEPWVTLYHWDLPSTLNDRTNKGGWLNPTISDRFLEYAEFCFETFGD